MGIKFTKLRTRTWMQRTFLLWVIIIKILNDRMIYVIMLVVKSVIHEPGMVTMKRLLHNINLTLLESIRIRLLQRKCKRKCHDTQFRN